MPYKPEDEAEHLYTKSAEEHQELRRGAEASGRHLISRDTDVLNGVWGANYDAEALVVDYDKESGYYDALADELIAKSSSKSEDGQTRFNKRLLLSVIVDYVREKLPYSLEGVEELYQQRLGGKPAKKISLACYVEEKVGVCRHQALLAATLLEILRNRGLVAGTARVNRSIQWPEEDDPAGHAWVRYTNSAGAVYIIDPAQNFVGTLEEAARREQGWNYFLPTDPKPKRIIGATAAHKIIRPEDIPRE